MMTGLIDIVSEHVKVKQIIAEGGNGWIVPAEDVAALSNQMREFIQHPERAAEMKRSAVRDARRYTWTDYQKRIVKLIRKTLNDQSIGVIH
jgi:glycosyltransferase involved in cell wall biosynthesis